MNFFFLKKGKDQLGSNRIYINNLSQWISELGHKVEVSNQLKFDLSYNVYILSKYSNLNDILEIKKFSEKTLVGLIHPTDLNQYNRKMMNNCDFLIVGSIEERDYYLNFHNNIIRFPQIEKIDMYNKVHKDNNKITIGYHGNLEHLEEMQGACSKAIEKLGLEHDIKFVAIYDFNLGKWKKGRPKNVIIEDINWTSIESLVNNLKNVDIGIVPGTNNFFLDHNNTSKNIFSSLIRKISGGDNNRMNDYILRFKVTSNAGRCFVFHQLGIPVVADFWPSHFEILGNSDCGFLAHSKSGWYESLKKLIISADLRQQISQNAAKLFTHNYNHQNWTRKVISQIKLL